MKREYLYKRVAEKLRKYAKRLFSDIIVLPILILLLPWRILRKWKFVRSKHKIKQILIIYMAEGLGDCIMLSGVLPAIRSKFPEAKICLLVFDRFKEYFSGNPNIDQLFVYSDYLFTKSSLLSFLLFSRHINHQCKPDVVLDLLPNKNLKASLLYAFIPSRISIGFYYIWKKVFFDIPVKINWDKHFYEAMFDPLKFLGIEKQEPIYWTPFVRAGDYLLDRDIGKSQTIFIAPGGKNVLLGLGDRYSWRFKYYPELVKLLSGEGYSIVLLGAEYDKDDSWDSFNPDKVINLIGKTNIRQLFYLIKHKADLVVCNNAGLLHVAVALGIPTVSYAGPLENIIRFGPYGNDGRHVVLQPKMNAEISKHDFLKAINERLGK